MVVEVKLFATFRQGRFRKSQVEFPKGSSLGDLLEDLRIPAKEVGILLVNGRWASSESTLTSHDVVSVFPSLGGG